jgi:hypothetical protein
METLPLFPETQFALSSSQNRTPNKSLASAKARSAVASTIIDPHMQIAVRLAESLAEQAARDNYVLSRRQGKKLGKREGIKQSHQKDRIAHAICDHLRASLQHCV